jgi:hypothetical protein
MIPESAAIESVLPVLHVLQERIEEGEWPTDEEKNWALRDIDVVRTVLCRAVTT